MKLKLIVLALLVSTTGLAKKYPMTASTIVPAAAGTLQTGQDKNGNTSIELQVHHLAAPQSLSTPENVYVVWVQHGELAPCKAGFLGIGKNLGGTFKSVTPYDAFQIWVSAEQDRETTSPRGPEVLKVSVEGK